MMRDWVTVELEYQAPSPSPVSWLWHSASYPVIKTIVIHFLHVIRPPPLHSPRARISLWRSTGARRGWYVDTGDPAQFGNRFIVLHLPAPADRDRPDAEGTLFAPTPIFCNARSPIVSSPERIVRSTLHTPTCHDPAPHPQMCCSNVPL